MKSLTCINAFHFTFKQNKVSTFKISKYLFSHSRIKQFFYFDLFGKTKLKDKDVLNTSQVFRITYASFAGSP